MKKTFIAFTALLGTIIGAGILGIPYSFMKAGALIGTIHLFFIGIIITLITLYLAEIILRTKGQHQLSGYAEVYLGKKGKMLMLFSVIFGLLSALTAYLIGEGESIKSILGSSINPIVFGLLFWIFITAISYLGSRALRRGDFIGVSALFIVFIFIIIKYIPRINYSNLSSINLNNLFFPFGIILFAYLAFSIIPEIKSILSSNKKSMKKIIIISYSSVFLIYLIFSLIVLGFKGNQTPEIATLALGKVFVLLGMITIFTAYLSLNIALIHAFQYDLKITGKKSWLITSFSSLILYLLVSFYGKSTFTDVLSIGGIISGGLAAILILLMTGKAKRKSQLKPEFTIPYNKYLSYLLILIFIIGAILEIISLLT